MASPAGPIPVFDGHNDTILRIRDGGVFLERDADGHIDLVRAREGGLVGGMCALFVRSGEREANMALFARGELPRRPSTRAAQQETLALLSLLLRQERSSRGAMRVVRTVSELEAAIGEKSFACVIHLEGAEAIDAELEALEYLYAAGVRSLGPVWSRRNIFGCGVPISYGTGPDCGPGLTKRGKRLVAACNEMGIVVDLAHITERGFWDVAKLSNAPLVASHSNAFALTATPRNLTDRQIGAIRESGGVIGINFAVDFLAVESRSSRSSLDPILWHIEHVIEHAGIDHVGLGSDFDGAEMPADIGDAAGLPRLIAFLEGEGFARSEIEKIASRNWLRVLRATWGA